MVIAIDSVVITTTTTTDKIDEYPALVMLFCGTVKMVLAADAFDTGFQFGDVVGGVVASAHDAVFKKIRCFSALI